MCDAVRGLSEYTTPYIGLLRAHAVRHGCYLISGTRQDIRDGQLLQHLPGFYQAVPCIFRTRFTAHAGRRRSGTDHGDVLGVFQTPHASGSSS
ncbi:MAG: hypothetical protein IPN75_15465 [Dechloromonas sp.]|uniref:Uncharacterized protein n=1 Tax=Candidatus Dechloromonas phosphorivorans TaxID=2899244 RepID=A0A9D7LPN1_9RHOO|nr:hypothetical protein [Candidatus Dechloromonas phosphorivorans]